MDILTHTQNILNEKKAIKETEEICLKHIGIIIQNKYYIQTINDVIGDVLMNTIKEKDDGSIELFLNKYQKYLVENIYNLFNTLSSYKYFTHNVKNFSVFKGVSNIKNDETMIFPIPFCCCVNFDNASEWCLQENSFIIEIKIDSSIPIIFTGNIEEGNEVILPKCKLSLIKTYFINDKKVKLYVLLL